MKYYFCLCRYSFGRPCSILVSDLGLGWMSPPFRKKYRRSNMCIIFVCR